MDKIFFFIPFGYFIKTRLNTKAAVSFHVYSEFLLGILLLLYSGISFAQALLNFFTAYFAFISIYEIGYITNDFISVRFEKNARHRLKDYDPGITIVVLWIIIRLFVFIAISYFNGFIFLQEWWVFYLGLGVVFFLHNILKRNEIKIFTFISLAFFRFYAPVFIFFSPAFFSATLPGISLFYILFRTFTYMYGKQLLVIPSRSSLSFKFNFYLLLLPVSIFISFFLSNWLCLWLNLYFLFFWSTLFLLDKLSVISVTDLRTE